MLALAFPPTHFALLVFVALVPWFLVLREAPGRAAFRSGLVFGFAFMLHQMWFLQPFVSRWTGSALVGAVPWVLSALIAMFYFGLLGWLVNRAFVLGRMALVPLVWAAVEVGRSVIPGLAFPWGLLPTPLWYLPAIVQHAAFGTVYLVSAWIVLINTTIVAMMTGAHPRLVFRMGAVSALFLILSLIRYQQPPEDLVVKRVTIGQLGVDYAFGDPETRDRNLFVNANTILASAMIEGTDLVVFPEGMTDGGPGLPPRSPFGPAPEVPVLFGGKRTEGSTAYQSAFAYDGEWQYLDKTRLVIFGEFVPFRDQLPWLARVFRLPGGDFEPGREVRPIRIDDVRIGPLICFEALFSYLGVRQVDLGAQMIAVMSIDDWYLATPAPEQLAAASILRGIENGVPVVRAAMMGISLATDVRGNVIARAPVGELTALHVAIALPRRSDAFPYRGLFPWIAGVGALAVLVEALLRRKSGPPRNEGPRDTSGAPSEGGSA